MTGTVFWICFISVAITMYLLARYVARIDIMQLSAPSLVLVSLFMFGFLGYAKAYYELDAGGDFRGMVDRNLLDRMFIYASYSIIMVVLGYALARRTLPAWLRPPAGENFRNISESRGEFFMIIALAVISVLVLLRVLYLAPVIAIFEAFKDNALEARLAARSEMFYDFPGKLWWYSLFYSSFLSVCCWAAFARVLLKFDWKRGVVFIAIFIPAFFAAIMTTAKAPGAWLLIGLVLTAIVVKGSGRVSMKAVLSALLAGMLFLGAAFYLVGVPDYTKKDLTSRTSKTIGILVSDIYSRAVGAEVMTFYYYMQIFPDKVGYLHGRSLPNPRNIFPFEPYSLSREVMKIVHPGMEEQTGRIGSAPTAYWGELYANFGPLGVFLPFSLLVGMAVYGLGGLYTHCARNPLGVGCYVWLLLHLKDLPVTSMFQVFVNIDLFFVTLVALTAWYVRRRKPQLVGALPLGFREK